MSRRPPRTNKQVYVHRNLNRRCWSVLLRGKLIDHRHQISLRDVEFRVRLGGWKRAVREGKRNVHAFGVGIASRGVPRQKPDLVRYDLRSGRFINREGRHVLGARVALFDKRGTVQVFGATYA